MGVRAVAVYSEADTRSHHVRAADEAILIGESPASESYLNVDKVLAEPDKGARAAYEERAARSEPGLEPGEGESGSGKKRTKSAASR